jgi:Skp family chaperone for outer membrane proteins
MSISKKIVSACCFISLSFTGFAKANLETEVKNLKALVEAQAKRITALESKQFGTVDLKKVLENSKLGKKAKAELQEFGMTLQKKSQAEQAELMKLQKSIQEDKLLAKDAKEKKMAEFQQKVQAFQMKQQQMQFEMQQKQAELMKGFFDKTI